MIFTLQPGLSYKCPPSVSYADHMRNLRLYLWTKSNGLCALCGSPLEVAAVAVDHIIPRSLGGEDGVHNLQAAHGPCNSQKSRSPMAYAITKIHGRHPLRSVAPQRAYKPKPRRVLSKLKHLRLLTALSQKDLATLAGMSQTTLSDLETGKTQARPSTMRKLSNALHCTPGDLLKAED